MKLKEVLELVEGRVVAPENADLDIEVSKVAASDLMSDVLALSEPGSLLVTGLATPQCVRTAGVVGIPVVLIVRNRDIMPETIKAAELSGVVLCVTKKGMYEVCGILYSAGLQPVYNQG
uniref:DRTGG domain-containing protein n=1 Tax=Fervidobacterium pennivorans TaxID=93466 RepID=A0A7V4KF53_FERPE